MVKCEAREILFKLSKLYFKGLVSKCIETTRI